MYTIKSKYNKNYTLVRKEDTERDFCFNNSSTQKNLSADFRVSLLHTFYLLLSF